MKKIKYSPILKVFIIRIDSEEKGTYYENITSYTILCESFNEAIEEAKHRILVMEKVKSYIIGEVKLANIID